MGLGQAFNGRGTPLGPESTCEASATGSTIHYTSAMRMTHSFGTPSMDFSLVPHSGIPQGSPESPAGYAAVIADLLAKVEDMLCDPAGLPLNSTMSMKEAEDYKAGTQSFQRGDIFAINFADSTPGLHYNAHSQLR